jgi:hypothetical protein
MVVRTWRRRRALTGLALTGLLYVGYFIALSALLMHLVGKSATLYGLDPAPLTLLQTASGDRNSSRPSRDRVDVCTDDSPHCLRP